MVENSTKATLLKKDGSIPANPAPSTLIPSSHS